MPNIIINNNTSNLKDKFKDLIPQAVEMKYLIGYFYFSAVPELYEELKQKEDLNIKILVGLKCDPLFTNKSQNYYENDIEEFIDRIGENFNSESLDTEEFYNQFYDFIKWVQEDKIIIRKTREDNHSKLYIFKYAPGTRDNRFITGSSNLTRAGLYGQDEFNVEVIHENDEKEAEKYFDTLWEDSIELTEDDFIKQKIIEKLTRTTQGRSVTPFEAYVYILKQYLNMDRQEEDTGNLAEILNKAGYTPYKYQTDAIREALYKIEKFGGVILGDVVGLGKSVIASMVARQLNGETLILCPPGLIGDVNTFGWKFYSEKFKIHAKVESSGSQNLKKINETDKYGNYDNVIIDEAHRFRNASTDTYGHLKNICRGKKVILLTATPFNNKPWDIHNLLSLFLFTKKEIVSTSETIFDKFNEANKLIDRIAYVIKNKDSNNPKVLKSVKSNLKKIDESLTVESIDENVIKGFNNKMKTIGNDIKDAISYYFIRRNRLDLEKNPDYIKDFKTKSEEDPFSLVEDPREGLYPLTPAVSDFYDDILEKYFGLKGAFTGAIYRPARYEIKENKENRDTQDLANQRQDQLYDFMKRIIVKRLESSFGAFEVSIKRFYDNHIKILDFVKKNKYYVLNRKFMTDYAYEEEDEILTLLDNIIDTKGKNFDKYTFTEKGLADFINDMEKDIKLFEEVKERFISLNLIEEDTKFEEFYKIINEIQKEEPNRKILVFTEFADTVEHIKKKLDKLGRKDIEYASAKNINYNTIEREFDASYEYRGLNIEDAKIETKNIIVATDVLSEGFNLNRAGVVINYDIPWNPVRVIQRLGRINRISKKVFDSLYIYNFFPSDKATSTIGVKRIATRKMLLIHNILGEDAKIFSPDEIPNEAGLYSKLSQKPVDNEEESFYTKVLNIYKEIENNPLYKDVLENIKDMPLRIKTAKKGDKNEVLLFIIKNDLYIRVIDTDNEEEFSEFKFNNDILQKIKCDIHEPKLDLSKAFWENYPTLKTINPADLPPLGVQSQAYKSYCLLKEIQNHIVGLGPFNILEKHSEFIKLLIRDIEKLGSLTNSDFKKICEWKIDDTLEENINKFYNYLGKEKYINSVKNPKEAETKIIVGFENQIN